MPKIIRILRREKRVNKGNEYYRTHALLDDGQEAVGFGKDFVVGDKVGYWYDDRYQLCKMKKVDNVRQR